MLSSNSLQRWLPAAGTAVPVIILLIAALSIVLTAAQAMGMSVAETSSWILVLYGLPGLLSLPIAIRYRQPLLFTGNIFMIIFIASLGDQMAYPELIGATVLAGLAVLLVSVLGLTRRLAAWFPAPIVLGLLAGAVTPFVTEVFTLLGDDPALVGGTIVAYLISRRYLKGRIPPILPTLLAGLLIAALTGQIGRASAGFSLPIPVMTPPVFSLRAIATATPVMVVLFTLQATMPSLIFVRSQGYEPPQRVVDMVGGAGTMLGSFFGPTGISLSLPVTSLVAGPAAGDPHLRYLPVYLGSGAAILIGLLAGFAADLPAIVPLSLLLTLAGLSLVDVLANALRQVSQGPLLLGPLFAFVIALSRISLLGFGPFFWSLVLGISVSMLLERDQL
jgi:benzoate membrane transport protein